MSCDLTTFRRLPGLIALTLSIAGLLWGVSWPAEAEDRIDYSNARSSFYTAFQKEEPTEANLVSFSSTLHFGRNIGFTGAASFFNERLVFTVSKTENRDLLDGRRVISEGDLEQNDNWQSEAGFSFTAPTFYGANFSMSGGVYDARRPASVRNPRLQIGFPARWGEHSGTDLAFSLGLFNDRLRYEGGFAQSRYRGSSDYEKVDRRPDRWNIRPSGNRGNAQRHRIDADLLTGNGADLSAFALYESTSTGFRFTPRTGSDLSFTGGEVRQFGASFNADELRMEVKHLDRQARGRAQQKLEGEVGLSATTFTLFHDVFTRGNGSTWRSREEAVGAAVALDLDALRGGDDDDSGLRLLFPSSLRLSVESGLVRYAQGPDDPPDAKTSASVALSWVQDGAFTNLSIYRSITGSPTTSSVGADESDFGVDLSQSFYAGDWDFTWYASIGGFDSSALGGRSRDRWMFGGVSFSYDLEDLPTISMALDFDRFEGDYPDFDEQFSEQSTSLDFSLDFSEYLHEGASMSLNYHVVKSQSRSSGLGRSGDLQTAISFTLGMQF